MLFSDDVILSLQSGKLVVIPTDTLYGIVCSARDKEAVERLYVLRGRDESKPCIILIADISDLQEFGIALNGTDTEILRQHWPGKVSVVFDCSDEDEKWTYLHRDTQTLAFRIPDDVDVRNLLHKTGPLLAPSANIQGRPSAHTVLEAKNYFGNQVTMYVDGGYRESLPSTVARLRDGTWEVLRQGEVMFTPPNS